MRCREITYYLEMTEPDQLVPARGEADDLEIRRVSRSLPELNHFFYTAIGGRWYWIDRLHWSRDQWLAYLEQPGMETWIALVSGTPAGYFELLADDRTGVEIVMFGLLEPFTGQGLGGHLLSFAVQRAWSTGLSRVWLHTSSFDHPHALSHYQARGFRLVDQVEAEKELPESAPDYWNTAIRAMYVS